VENRGNPIWFRAIVSLAAGALFFSAVFRASSEDTNTNSVSVPATNSVVIPATNSVAATATPARRQLSGAELYSMHCNRCHPERYPTERTAAQWKTILLHMRVRANLPAEHARTILKYLQENSGR
jgi:hypothetical protein